MVIMELKTKIENPGYDGRKRSGWQSNKQFDAGTRFSLSGGDGGNLAARFLSGGDPVDDQRVIVALLANAGPTEARDFNEVMATLPWAISTSAVLDELFAAGIVTAPDVRKAAQTAHDKREAEDAARTKELAELRSAEASKAGNKPADAKAGAKAGVPA